MSKDRTALIVFAREPRAGKVKTRMLRDLPAGTVNRLYKAFIRDVLAEARKVRCDDRCIYFTGSGGNPAFLKKIGHGFRFKRQQGKDLGERMHRAFVRSQKAGFEKTVIIGTDCPTLSAKDMKRAFHLLSRRDVVLGPAKDGGYYLIGLRNPCPALFRGVPWGTENVLSSTIRKVSGQKKDVALLRKRRDVDTASDLSGLKSALTRMKAGAHTRRALGRASFKACFYKR